MQEHMPPWGSFSGSVSASGGVGHVFPEDKIIKAPYNLFRHLPAVHVEGHECLEDWRVAGVICHSRKCGTGGEGPANRKRSSRTDESPKVEEVWSGTVLGSEPSRTNPCPSPKIPYTCILCSVWVMSYFQHLMNINTSRPHDCPMVGILWWSPLYR